MGAEIRAKGAREAAQKGAREADRCRNRSLVDRMEGYGSVGPYRPEALRQHDNFKQLY